MKQSVIVLTFFCLFGYITAKYPSELRRCHFGDTTCISRTIEEYASKLKTGHRDLGLVPIDPLQVDEVDIDQGNTSPVNIKLKFRDLKCHGLSTVHIKKVVGFQKDLANSKFEIYAQIARISLVGQYKARGNILLLPVFGSGAANLTFDDVDASIKFVSKVEVKKGKQHLRVKDLILDFDTTRLWMNFDNLFDGDNYMLSQSTNVFLNDNWSDILRELKPVLTKTIGGIYKAVAEPIFIKYPYEELFLADDE